MSISRGFLLGLMLLASPVDAGDESAPLAEGTDQPAAAATAPAEANQSPQTEPSAPQGSGESSAAPAPGEALRGSSGESIERFTAHLTAREDLSPEARDPAIAAVHEAFARTQSPGEALAAGLRRLSAEFARGLAALTDEQPAEAVKILTPLSLNSDPYLSAEASVFLARALVQQGDFENALPQVQRTIERHPAPSLRAPEAWLLKGRAEAALLDIEAARKSLESFLDRFPKAPGAWRETAQDLLAHLQETEFDTLSGVHVRMQYSSRRLGLEDPGERTRAAQDEAVALLDELIDELEKKSGSCKGCKKGSGSGNGQGGRTPGLSSGLSQAPELNERSVKQDAWVDLSSRAADPQAFNAARARQPTQYRDLVDQYFRSFRPENADEPR